MKYSVFALAFLLIACSTYATGSKKPASVTATQRFSEFIFGYIKNHEVELPQTGGPQAADPDSESYLKSREGRKQLEMYVAALPEKIDGLHWTIEELPADLELPTVHPVSPYTNRALFWALGKDDIKRFAFRPVDTTTGCDTGCTPVVFHLLMDSAGKTLKVIEEPDRPLRKAYHQVLTNDDRKKLLELAQKLPAAMQTITEPKSLVNWEEKFPPQTWTFFSSFTVKDAAFTSYRVFEAALSSLRAIKERPDGLANKRYSLEEAVGNYLRISTLEQAHDQFNAARADLENDKIDGKIRALHFKFLPYLLVWMSENGDGVNGYAQELFSLPSFVNEHQADYCNFEKNLMNSAAGRDNWTAWRKSNKQRPACGDRFEKFLALYVKAMNKSSEPLLVADLQGFDLNALPTFVRNRPDMLLNVVKALPNRDALRLKILALINAYYPKAFSLPKMSDLDMERKQIPAEVSAEVHRDRVIETQRKFLAEKIVVPVVPLTSRRGKSVGNSAFTKLKEPTLVIFFASWCPHCQETLTKLVAANINPDIWKHVQLVETFIRSNDDLEHFCEVTHLPKKSCDSVYRMSGASPLAEAFTKAMGIHSVPRFILIGKGGTLLAGDLELQDRPYTDVNNELSLIFEAAKENAKIQEK